MTPDLESLGSIPKAIVGVGLLLAAAWGVSGPLLPRREHRDRRDAAFLQLAVGLNLVSFFGVVLGQLGWLGGYLSIWLLLGLSLLTLPRLRAPVPSPPSAGERVRVRGVLQFVPRWATWLTLLPIALTLGPALCYPTGWDELVYHGVLPRRWLADGHPAFYVDLPYSAFPSSGEILFWLIAPLESVIAPRLVIWVCWILGLALLYRLLRGSLSRGSSLILTGAFGLSSAALLISANCYVESILMMNVAAIMLTASSEAEGPRPLGSSVFLGILAGGAAAVKLTGVTVLVLPLLWYCGVLWTDRSRWKSPARSALLCLTVSLCVALPFYLRPWLATGNPCYPYFAEWFSDDPARLDMSRYHHTIGDAAFGVRSLTTFVAGPLLLAFSDQTYDGSFGWQFLVLLALGAIAVGCHWRRFWDASAHLNGADNAQRHWRPRAAASGTPLVAATVAGTLYVFWYFTAQQARFAVPAALALTVVAGFGLQRLHGLWHRFTLAALLTATVVSLPWRTAALYFGSWETVCGIWTWTEYVDDGTRYRYVPLVNAVRDLTPADARVMLLLEHRSLYVPREWVIATPYFQEAGFMPPDQFADADRMLALLAHERITHLVMAKSPEGPDWAPEWWDRLQPVFGGIAACLETGRLRVAWESEHYLLLEVHSGSLAPSARNEE